MEYGAYRVKHSTQKHCNSSFIKKAQVRTDDISFPALFSANSSRDLEKTSSKLRSECLSSHTPLNHNWLKILQLIQKQQLRGAEIFASQLSAHLSEKGNTVILVNLFGGDAALPFDGQTTTLNGNQKARLHDVAGWRKLAQIIRDENPDVIQANAGDTLKYAVFSKIFFRWKSFT